MQQLKSASIDDMFARNGRIRPDGRMVHDLHLVQVTARGEVKDKWDYYTVRKPSPATKPFERHRPVAGHRRETAAGFLAGTGRRPQNRRPRAA
jgi:hypothetical protein